jgi:hypothetical protein
MAVTPFRSKSHNIDPDLALSTKKQVALSWAHSRMRFEVPKERREAFRGNLRFSTERRQDAETLTDNKDDRSGCSGMAFFYSTTAYDYPIIIERTIHVRFG